VDGSKPCLRDCIVQSKNADKEEKKDHLRPDTMDWHMIAISLKLTQVNSDLWHKACLFDIDTNLVILIKKDND
jgi:hypothetical protein